MDIQQQLTQLGFNEKQAKIYLALLELGASTALDVSRRAGIKRPTTYVILDELQERGLVRPLKKGATTLYEPEDPSVLGDHLRKRVRLFNNMAPLLSDLYAKQGEKPNVKYYSGIDELDKMYRKILDEHREFVFFGTDLETFEKNLPGILKEYTDKFENGEYTVREVVTSNRFNINYARKHYSRFHKIRVLDKKYNFYGDNAIFGSSLLLASFGDEPFAVTIESKDVVKTFRSMFNLAWDQAKPPRDIPKKES